MRLGFFYVLKYRARQGQTEGSDQIRGTERQDQSIHSDYGYLFWLWDLRLTFIKVLVTCNSGWGGALQGQLVADVVAPLVTHLVLVLDILDIVEPDLTSSNADL